MPFSKLNRRKGFFAAWICIECNVSRTDRTCEDLRKMGVVAALEWQVLARIKKSEKEEPKLNKR